MSIFLLSFLAGILTVLAPCVLPVLPVIIGGSLTDINRRWKPLIIISSLGVSVVFFTLLLKATVLLIGVPFEVLSFISGGIIIFVGLTFLFPRAWDAINVRLGLYTSENMMRRASNKGGVLGDIFLGAALGPVFSSCSPTYAIIVATILPISIADGFVNLVIYALGLALPLLLIAYIGRGVVQKFRPLANPNGLFKRSLGILLILVGVFVLSGLDKKVQTYLVENNILGSTILEQQLVDLVLPQGVPITPPQSASGAMLTQSEEGFPFKLSYQAPELQGLTNWINSEPLTMEDLEGKVVLVDFWTFSCINCIRTLPYMRELQEKYADKGLVILGIHAPEFAFERVPENVAKSVKEYDLKYPVALDNDFVTWRAYQNRYWPAKYLIDKQGNVRYTHFGEGAYEETEEAIVALLEDAGSDLQGTRAGALQTSVTDFSQIRTPEIYIGASRQDHFGGGEYQVGESKNFSRPVNIERNTFYLTGTWEITEEHATLQSEEGSIIVRYAAPKANIVLEGAMAQAEVLLDGEMLTSETLGKDVLLENGKSTSVIDTATLYNFTKHSEKMPEHVLEVHFKKPGVKAFAFTFG